MYSYLIDDTSGQAGTITETLAALRAALAESAHTRTNCRWAITSPADRLHLGATTFRRPYYAEAHVVETLETVRENLEYEATQPPLN